MVQHRIAAFLCILEFSGHWVLGSEPGLERLGGTESSKSCGIVPLVLVPSKPSGRFGSSTPHCPPRIKAFRMWEGWGLLWFGASVSEWVWLIGWTVRREVSDLQVIPSVIFYSRFTSEDNLPCNI